MFHSCLSSCTVSSVSLVTLGFAALQSWKLLLPQGLGVLLLSPFCLGDTGGGRASRGAAAALDSESSLLAPRAGHSRGGLEAVLLPHLAPSLCCPRATWPPASVMVTGDVCCQCRSLWRTLGSPGSTTGFLCCYCSSCFVSSCVQMEKARERRWERERLAFKTTQR